MGEVDSLWNSSSELTSLQWGLIFNQSETNLPTDCEIDESKNGFRTKYHFNLKLNLFSATRIVHLFIFPAWSFRKVKW